MLIFYAFIRFFFIVMFIIFIIIFWNNNYFTIFNYSIGFFYLLLLPSPTSPPSSFHQHQRFHCFSSSSPHLSSPLSLDYCVSCLFSGFIMFHQFFFGIFSYWKMFFQFDLIILFVSFAVL